MEAEKPKSIKTIGLIIAISSGFIIFSNTMGALAWSVIGIGDLTNQSKSVKLSERSVFELLLENYVFMCLTMVTIGILYLIGGVYVRQYKLWAKQTVSAISIILVILIWTLMISMATMTAGQHGLGFFRVGAILSALFWSAPIILLIWFLNKEKIKRHFV